MEFVPLFEGYVNKPRDENAIGVPGIGTACLFVLYKQEIACFSREKRLDGERNGRSLFLMGQRL
jgi:hypothetical protein